MIYLMRHGEIDSGGRRFIGQTDIPLNPEGERQASAWRDRLSEISWAGVWSSDLRRSAKTAEIVSGGPSKAVPAFREIHLGEWEGRPMAGVRERQPQLWVARGERIDRFRPPGGESFADLLERVMPAFEEIAAVPGPVLLVGHAGVNRTILSRLLGMPLSGIFQLGQDYGGLNRIDPTRRPFRVVSVNESPVPGV